MEETDDPRSQEPEIDDEEVLAAADRLLDAIWDGLGQVSHRDIETVACHVLWVAGEGDSAFAKRLGSKGGKKGGKARAAKLTPEERSKIARKAARARWGKDSEDEDSTA